jgi:hypothetical protein
MVTQAVATLAPAPVALRPDTFNDLLRIAETLAKSALVPTALRGKPQDIAVVLMTGQELGLAPMQAIRSINVIEGKASMSADLMVGLVKRSEVCEYFSLIASDDKAAEYATLRRGDLEPTRLRYTLVQATAAGLTGKDVWKKHPAALLRARCASGLARAVYPDITLGIYDPDEAEEIAERAPRRALKKAPEPVDPEIPAEIQVEVVAPEPVSPVAAAGPHSPFCADGIVVKIDERSGKKAPFWALVLDSGEEFLTFDTAIRDFATEQWKAKATVRVAYEPTAKGNNKVIEMTSAAIGTESDDAAEQLGF